ncbi:hypothetical protein BSW63_22910 [Salmonella enterica subsp. enterica serovar Enteritidis]|nr:hypothetical protein [Salmonella enterica subsp. enterica serovar Enteritidis]
MAILKLVVSYRWRYICLLILLGLPMSKVFAAAGICMWNYPGQLVAEISGTYEKPIVTVTSPMQWPDVCYDRESKPHKGGEFSASQCNWGKLFKLNPSSTRLGRTVTIPLRPGVSIQYYSVLVDHVDNWGVGVLGSRCPTPNGLNGSDFSVGEFKVILDPKYPLVGPIVIPTVKAADLAVVQYMGVSPNLTSSSMDEFPSRPLGFYFKGFIRPDSTCTVTPESFDFDFGYTTEGNIKTNKSLIQKTVNVNCKMPTSFNFYINNPGVTEKTLIETTNPGVQAEISIIKNDFKDASNPKSQGQIVVSSRLQQTGTAITPGPLTATAVLLMSID